MEGPLEKISTMVADGGKGCPTCRKTLPLLSSALDFISRLLSRYEQGSTLSLSRHSLTLELEYLTRGYGQKRVEGKKMDRPKTVERVGRKMPAMTGALKPVEQTGKEQIQVD